MNINLSAATGQAGRWRRADKDNNIQGMTTDTTCSFIIQFQTTTCYTEWNINLSIATGQAGRWRRADKDNNIQGVTTDIPQ